MTTFANDLLRRRAAAGLSLRHLAALVPCSRTHLADVETGTKRPSPSLADAIDRALKAGGALAALNTDEPERLDLASTTRRVDPTVADNLAQVLAGQRNLDDTMGSAAVLPSAVAQLTLADGLVKDAHGTVRSPLVAVTAQLHQFAGWLYTTGGQWTNASTQFQAALELATEAGDHEMVATVLSYQGHVAWLSGHIGPVVGLSRAALRDERVYVGQRAYDAFQAARGHAVAGEVGEALNLLAMADDLAAANESYTGPRPPWQYYRAPWFFRLERGLAWHHLARHQPHRAMFAAEELGRGLDGLPAEWCGSEWAAEYRAHHAAALIRAGAFGEARSVLAEATRVAAATASGRVAAMCARLEADLV